MRRLPLLLALLGATVQSRDQGARAAGPPGPTPDERQKRIEATRVTEPPVLDGRLDDAAWTAVRPDDRFTQNFPDEGRPPTERTEVRVIYDDRALYIAVRCHDREPAKIVERLTRRDRETDADKIAVDVDSHGDRTDAYHFEVNVSGVLTDAQRFNDTDYNPDWDGLWNAITARDPGGWTVEMEIPWRTLRFAGGEPVMGLQIRRSLQRRQEIDEWAYTPRTLRAEVSRYGQLVGVRGLGPARLVQVQPYLAAGLTIQSGSGADDKTVITPNGGVDLKIGLNSNLTLDATFNPDFGQVEADQVVLNLTTFEVFYPEKRPFFLEGADLFATPLKQFYTRRVGRAPPAAYLNDGEVLVDDAITGRIWGAAKLSGQIVPHFSIAALDAVTAEQTVAVRRPGASAAERRLVDPLANYAVLRLRSDWNQSYIGILATAVNRFEPAYAATPDPVVDLCPDENSEVKGRCTHDAYTAGLDGRYITANSHWGISAHAVWSRIEHGPTRTLPDGTTIGPGDNGYGLSVVGGKQGGDYILFGLRYEGQSPTLDLNDAGFLRRQNSHFTNGWFVVRSTKPLGPTLESNWETYAFYRLSWYGDTLERGLGTGGWARFKNFWQIYVGGGYGFGRYDNRETRDGALTERVGGFWGDLYLRTDPRKALIAETNLHVERVQHGNSFYGDLTLSYRPVPQLELTIIPRVNYTYGDLRYAYRKDAIDGGTRYWFGDLESSSFDVTLRGTYTFTPRLTLQTYAQVFVAAGSYSNFVVNDAPLGACPAGRNPCPAGVLPLANFAPAPSSLGASEDFREGAINVNVVLRWEFLPGSTLMAVYTRSQRQPDYDFTIEGRGAPDFRPFRAGPATDVLLVKLSYLWR